jgi:histone-lysine N-methyltransferase SETMAR
MTKVCAKMVPRLLTPEQKENGKRICTDILEQIQADSHFLDKVIACDETWIFTYDPETKRHWKTPSSPKMKKARHSKSKFKAMLIVFFDIKGVIFQHWVPEGRTVNQHYYKNVLQNLRERIRRKRPKLWKNGFILHQDNAPAHTALSVKQFLVEKQTAVLEHHPYSPDLAPCDFFLFPKVKSVLKGTHFASVTEVKKKMTELLRQLTDDELQHGFYQWKIRMQQCVDAEGEYIEGEWS